MTAAVRMRGWLAEEWQAPRGRSVGSLRRLRGLLHGNALEAQRDEQLGFVLSGFECLASDAVGTGLRMNTGNGESRRRWRAQPTPDSGRAKDRLEKVIGGAALHRFQLPQTLSAAAKLRRCSTNTYERKWLPRYANECLSAAVHSFGFARTAQPLDPKSSRKGEPLWFSFPVGVAPGPKVSGDQVRREGPERRFVYIRIGQLAGDTSSSWSRRMKIDIHDVGGTLLARATEGKGVVEIEVNGTAKDGTPACATVPSARMAKQVRR